MQTSPDPSCSQPISPDSEEELSLLAAGCQQLGIELPTGALAAFARYGRELVEWNTRLNLTSIVASAEIQTKHFLDSLVSLPVLAEELGQPLPALRLLDVGTGAGFPGIPLKLALPALQLTLMEGTQKKLRFWNTSSLSWGSGR